MCEKRTLELVLTVQAKLNVFFLLLLKKTLDQKLKVSRMRIQFQGLQPKSKSKESF